MGCVRPCSHTSNDQLWRPGEELPLKNTTLLSSAGDCQSQASSWILLPSVLVSPPLRLLLVPPPQLVHLLSGPRANAAGEGGVVSALHLVDTQQQEAESCWEPGGPVPPSERSQVSRKLKPTPLLKTFQRNLRLNHYLEL